MRHVLNQPFPQNMLLPEAVHFKVCTEYVFQKLNHPVDYKGSRNKSFVQEYFRDDPPVALMKVIVQPAGGQIKKRVSMRQAGQIQRAMPTMISPTINSG